jgi:hypothetical protein
MRSGKLRGPGSRKGLCSARRVTAGCERIQCRYRFARWIRKSVLLPTTAAPALQSESIRWLIEDLNCGGSKSCQPRNWECKDGEYVRTAGCVIARQRPGTTKGFIFLSMEDESGTANVIVTPDLYERERLLVSRSKFLIVEGPLQNQDGVIHSHSPVSLSNLPQNGCPAVP